MVTEPYFGILRVSVFVEHVYGQVSFFDTVCDFGLRLIVLDRLVFDFEGIYNNIT
jgi:hypothetical protein